VNRIPLLTEKEESDLAHSFREKEDLEAARKLVLSHLRLVVAIARGYLGYGLPHADLIQEGNVGLMKAVKRFDPDRGVRLVSFAIHWIKAEIHEYIVKNWRLVKIATTKAQRKLFFNLRSMKSSSSTLQGEEVLAVAQHWASSPKKSARWKPVSGQEMALKPARRRRGASPHRLPGRPPRRAVRGARPAPVRPPAGRRPAPRSPGRRSRSIVQRRWLTEGDAATLHELAAEYGVSAERIRQIEAKAMQKMRTQLAALA
jgi:RNA polymerase sigma-32 factor